MTDQEYFSIEALSYSFLKEFAKSPAHAFIKREPSTSMEVGTMIHKYLLEREDFLKSYHVIDSKVDKRKKEIKELIESMPDKIIIGQDEKELLENVGNAVNNCQSIPMGEIIGKSQREKVIEFDYMNEPCKCKIDVLYETINSYLIIDLKTCQSVLDFQRNVNNYKYYMQAYFYSLAIEKTIGVKPMFYFMAIETEKPFGVKMFSLNEEYMDQGRLEIIDTIIKYKKWIEHGADRSKVYDSEIVQLKKPAWLGVNE